MEKFEKLDHQVEQNLIDLCIKASMISGGEYEKNSKYSWVKNPYVDWYCRIFNIRIPKINVKEEINILSRKIEKGLVPKYLMIKSSDQSLILEEYLEKLNYKMFYQQAGMAIDLTAFNYKDVKNGFNIRAITSEEDLKEWVLTTEEAFGKERNKELYRLFLKEKDIKFYSCCYEGKVVSTLMLFIKNDIAGIHLVGTKKEFRGKGFGTLITQIALNVAKEQGCRYSVLQASDMGKKIYKDIGFNEYCTIRHWEYKLH